jgi:hypothetical protein
MTHDRRRTGANGLAALAAAVLLAAGTAAEAAPFAAVVPKEIRVDTTAPAYRITFSYWGWIAATGDSLTQADMSTAQIDIQTDGNVSISQEFTNLGMVTPLRTGEVAGRRIDPYNTVMDTLLEAGETLKAPDTGFFTTDMTFDSGYTDTVSFTSTITMAGEELTYTTTMIFGELGSVVPVVVEGQRAASTPVPVTVERTRWGSLKVRFLPGGKP